MKRNKVIPKWISGRISPKETIYRNYIFVFPILLEKKEQTVKNKHYHNSFRQSDRMDVAKIKHT